MYENHKEIVRDLCIRTTKDGSIVMCDKIVHPSGQVDAVPKFVERYPAGYVCSSYAFPESRLKVGGCALCSISEVTEKKSGRMINPIKASKRNL